MTLEEAMHRADPNQGAALDQSRLNLDQGQVALLGNQFPDEVAMRLDPPRMPVTAARLGDCLTMFQSKLPPADRTRGADPKMRCSRAAAHATVNRRNHPVPKIL